MSILGNKSQSSMGRQAKEALKAILLTQTSTFGKDDVHAYLGLESLTSKTNEKLLIDSTSHISSLLRSSPEINAYVDLIAKGCKGVYVGKGEADTAFGMEKLQQDWKTDTYDRLAISVMAQMNPAKTVMNYNNMCPTDTSALGGNYHILNTGAGTLASLSNPKYSQGWGLESFDPATHMDFIAASALINVTATVPGAFEEVFFQGISLPPGQSGFDVMVQVPKILVTRFRNVSSGAAWDEEKISIVQAAYDPSILSSNSINIIPIVIDDTNPPQLVPQSVVPAWTVNVLGTDVETRPILFGPEVGLIELSTFGAILNNGQMDATDALYTNVGVQDVFFQIDISVGTAGVGDGVVTTSAVLKNNVTSIVGTLLQQKQIGRAQSLQTVTKVPLFVTENSIPVSGATQAELSGVIQAALGLSASTPFNLRGVFTLTSEADTEIGSMMCGQLNPSLQAVTGTTTSGMETQPVYNLAALNGGAGASKIVTTITPIGWYPNARRTNSNLRVNGTIIDANNIVNYRLPINVFPPFTARTPINQTDQITFETLGNVTALWVSGQCVDKLIEMENWLETVSGTPMGVGTMTNQCPIMGGEYVIPTLRTDLVNIYDLVDNWQSKDLLANIRAQFQVTLMYASAQLYMDSGYSSALQMLLQDLDAYETIVVTDPLIAQFMMEAGDIRTMGDNRKYVFCKTNNNNIRGKIYYSFRLVGSSDLVHPMSFGCRLQSPNITYEVVPMNRGGANIREIQSMPRVVPFVNLPVLGVINVEGLSQFATTAAQH
jgi:hypothetical protein